MAKINMDQERQYILTNEMAIGCLEEFIGISFALEPDGEIIDIALNDELSQTLALTVVRLLVRERGYNEIMQKMGELGIQLQTEYERQKNIN
jgi:hypothetical protein